MTSMMSWTSFSLRCRGNLRSHAYSMISYVGWQSGGGSANCHVDGDADCYPDGRADLQAEPMPSARSTAMPTSG